MTQEWDFDRAYKTRRRVRAEAREDREPDLLEINTAEQIIFERPSGRLPRWIGVQLRSKANPLYKLLLLQAYGTFLILVTGAIFGIGLVIGGAFMSWMH